MVAEVVLASVAFVCFVTLARWARRTRRATDTIGRYARAVSALRTIADDPSALVPPHPHAEYEDTPSVHMISDVTHINRTRLYGSRNRNAGRPDPELLERRPVIAHLPSISASRADEAGKEVG